MPSENQVDRATNAVQAAVVHGGVHVHSGREVLLALPRQVPTNIPNFVGRDGELAKLHELATRQTGTGTIAIIAGSPGVGKTALAVQWAHQARERFPDGDLYVDFHGYSAGEPVPINEALAGFLGALDVPGRKIPRGMDAKSALFRSLLDGRRMVILLDNVTSPDQVRALLPGTPSCVVVVTSRSRLPGLVARNGAYRITLDMLSPAQSAYLLKEVIGVDRVRSEPDAVDALADRCGHLPLALRIAGERVATHTYLRLADVLDELETSQLDVLETEDDDTSALRVVFSWSYRALSPAAARMFRVLGLHPGPDISTAAAAVLSGDSVTDTRRELDTLAGGYLLMETGRDRFRLHDLLRAYARERAEAEETGQHRDMVVHRLLEWFLLRADAADHMLTPERRRVPLPSGTRVTESPVFADHGAALRWCEDELANLVAAVRVAMDIGRLDIACRLPLALWAFFTIRKPWADWITTYQLGVAAAQRTGDRFSEAALRSGLGIAHRDLRRFEEAFEYFESALAIRDEIGDGWGRGQTLVGLGIAHNERAEHARAFNRYEQALAVFQDLSDEWGTATTLHHVGVTLGQLGELDTALRNLHRALEIRHAIGYRYGEAETLADLGRVLCQLGRDTESIDHLNQAIAIRREIGDHYGEAAALDDLGQILLAAGRPDRARANWTAALAIFNALGAPRAAEVFAQLSTLD